MSSDQIQYEQGFEDADRMRVAELLEEAFESKLAAAIANKQRRMALMSEAVNPQSVMVAREQGEIVDIAAFSDESSMAFAEGSLSDMMKVLGFFRGLRAAFVLSLLELKPKPGSVVLDTLAVDGRMRGRGVGSELIKQLEVYAKANGCEHLYLDVVSSNPRAKQLYERIGFKVVNTRSSILMRWLFGFNAVDTMRRDVGRVWL